MEDTVFAELSQLITYEDLNSRTRGLYIARAARISRELVIDIERFISDLAEPLSSLARDLLSNSPADISRNARRHATLDDPQPNAAGSAGSRKKSIIAMMFAIHQPFSAFDPQNAAQLASLSNRPTPFSLF